MTSTEGPQSPLRAKRSAAGLSQSELSRRSGVGREVIYKLESGARCVVTLARLRAIGAVLDADPVDLVAPGQAVQCESRAELDEFAGDRGWRSACESEEAWSVVAQWLGHDPAAELVHAYVDSIRNMGARS